MKSDLPLGDKEAKKSLKIFIKKELSNRIRFFLIVNLPMRPELVVFIAFSLLGTHNWFISGLEI